MVRARLEALSECSITVHPAANGYLVATPGRKRRRGKKLAALPHMPMAQKVSSLRGTALSKIVYGITFTSYYLYYTM